MKSPSTHCRNGHERTAENTYFGGKRPQCRLCNLEAVKRYKARNPNRVSTKPPEARPGLEDRFWSKVETHGSDECWPWQAQTNRRGYGLISRAGRMVCATHVSLEFDGRTRPSETHEACHACDNPGCVNPAHLWWGTRHENQQDKVRKGRHHSQLKTHCPQGHAYSGHNLILNLHGYRVCRTCNNEASRRWMALRKGELHA